MNIYNTLLNNEQIKCYPSNLILSQTISIKIKILSHPFAQKIIIAPYLNIFVLMYDVNCD